MKNPATMFVLFLLLAASLGAAETAIPVSPDDWKAFDEATVSFDGGELILDGRKAMSKAVYLPLEWEDVSLEADFRLDPASDGVLACGFMVRVADALHSYYVHFDKSSAILCRSDANGSWHEITRTAIDRPAGEWHRGKLEIEGDTLTVSLNEKRCYQVSDASLAGKGRIGFYANQGVAHVKNIQAAGRASKTDEPFVIPPPLYVFVCTDAGAGAYEAFPDVCRLKDGRLMCVFYAGYGHVALPNEQLPKGGRISYCTSDDEGKTWSDAKVLYDGPNDDRDPSITQLKDGRLLCIFFSLERNPGPGRFYRGLGTFLIESNDAGETWSEARRLYPDYYVSAPVRELSDGRLIAGLYKEDGDTAYGAVGISDDGGKTWSAPIDIPNSGMRLDAETDVIELKDGTLYAALRRDGGNDACYSISKDRGMTWSPAKELGFPGHCHYLHRAPGDIILMAHRLPQTSLHYSLDECKTWSDNVLVDADHIGAYPSMVTLKDGTILIVYYEEGEGSNIKAKRFRATKDGIEWLPLK